MLGAVSSATLHPGAVIAAIGGTQYCQNFELGELQIARTIKGQTDSAVLANFGYLASCGPTLTAKPVGVECDLPGANERFQLSTRTVFVIAGPIQASGSNLMLYQVRWTFPIDSSDVVDLTSVNAGTMKLDDLVRTANSGG